MLRILWKSYSRRNFSKTTPWRDTKKPVPTETPLGNSENASVKFDIIPTNWDKWLLVYSKKYKSVKEIPSRIPIETINKAKSLARIKIANGMMVVTLICCVIIAWTGKKQAETGDSISKRELKKQEDIKARYKAKMLEEAQAKAKALEPVEGKA